MFTGGLSPAALTGEQVAKADAQHHRDKDGKEE